MKTRI